MNFLSEYRVLDILMSNDEISLFRVERLSDKETFIYKTIEHHMSNSSRMYDFKQEYEQLEKLDGQGYLIPYQLDMSLERPGIMFLDFAGKTLEQVSRSKRNSLTLKELLDVALSIISCVNQLQRAGMHITVLTPSDILVSEVLNECKLFDLSTINIGGGSPLYSESTTRMKEIIHYIAPELGRKIILSPTNQSDIYCIGVILYEWFANCLPFYSNGTPDEEFSYSVRPITDIDPSIPSVISEIVLKCLDKNPKKRYSTMFSLYCDIEQCLLQLKHEHIIEEFTLAKQDYFRNYIQQENIIGHHTEQRQFNQVLRTYKKLHIKVVAISGISLIGKTFFANRTLNQHTNLQQISISCLQKNNDTPHSTLINIITQMLDVLLTYSHPQLEGWKAEVIRELIVPTVMVNGITYKLQQLLGKDYEEILKKETDNYDFYLFLKKIYLLVTRYLKDTVIFINHAHELDEDSLAFIKERVSEDTNQHILFVFAFRAEHDSKVQDWMAKLAGKSYMYHLKLQLVQETELLQELSPLFENSQQPLNEFVSLLIEETEGYPEEIKEYIQRLIDDDILFFNSEKGCWEWELNRIRQLNLNERAAISKVELLSSQPALNKKLFALAAMLGEEFSIDDLAQLTEMTIEELMICLEETISKKIIYKKDIQKHLYAFQHSRLREFSLHFLDESEKKLLHSKVGRLLLKRKIAGANIPTIEILMHWNIGNGDIEKINERKFLIKLNIDAGLELREKQKFFEALHYLTEATSILGSDGWKTCYPLTYQAFFERAKLEFLCLDYSRANDTLEEIVRNAHTNAEKVEAIIQLVQLELGKDRYKETTQLCDKALMLLNVNLESKPSQLNIINKYIRVSQKLKKFDVHSMKNHVRMSSQNQLSVMRILSYYADAIYSLDKNKWFYITLHMIEKTIEEGLSDEVAIAFANYAIVLNHKFKDYEAAYKWGLLAFELSETTPHIHIRTYSTFIVCYDSWYVKDRQFLIKNVERISQLASSIGDVWNGNYAMIISCATLFHFGYPLKDIYVRLMNHASEFKEDKTKLVWTYAGILANGIKLLTGYSSNNDSFITLSEIELDRMKNNNDEMSKQILALYYRCQYVIAYLHGKYEQALDSLEYSMNFTSMYKDDVMEEPSDYVYFVLIMRQLISQDKKDVKNIKRMNQCLKKIKNIAQKCPSNYMHKYYLLKAEIKSLTKDNYIVSSYYEQALHEAYNNGFIHDAAIIAEAYAKYGLRVGKLSLARFYMNEAYEAYTQWGAVAVAEQLEKNYSFLIGRHRLVGIDRTNYSSVVKATQEISMEMEKSKLLHTIMKMMLQHAGAQYGAFILTHDDSEIVEIYGEVEKLQVNSIKLEDAEAFLPVPIIRYTIKTKEEVIIHDVANNVFSSILAERQNHSQSILCLPILNQNKLIGVLYIENKVASGVFTKERFDVLKLLSTQCAISINNAELYSGLEHLKNNLEQQVEQRTRDLERSMQATSEALSETIVYAERTRIAQEIHDIVGHTLTSTILQIEAGKRLLQKDTNQSIARFQEAQNLVRHSLNEIRNSVHMLREDKYYEIYSALKQLIKDTEQNAGVSIHIKMDTSIVLSLMQKKAIYHALQEGLTNGIKHGKSTEFHFSLYQDEHAICMLLGDNGLGSEKLENGFGLTMMRERVEQLNGKLHIVSEANQGYLLRIELPRTS